MYGFLITKNCPAAPAGLRTPKTLSFGEMRFYYNPLPKFERDKLFYEDAEKLVLLDGAVLNKRELMDARPGEDWRAVFDALYRADRETFPKSLRGPFCGAVFDKAAETLLLFTNQSGEKTVYYTQQAGYFAASSHNNILTEVLREQGAPVEPDLQSCHELLITGTVLHGKTPFRDVHRLTAGKYLLADGTGCREERYHMFRNVPEHDMSLEECITEVDLHFRKAVNRLFAKSAEYGYQAECDLSGGLDSRMVTWVAHDLGYRNVLNVCYCQSGKIDHTTSKKIARDLGNEYFFLPMDGGEFLKDVDETVDKFGGQVSYIVCTGANRAMREIAKHNVGLCATGLLGELPNAYWVEGATHTPPQYIHNRYSHVIPLNVSAEYARPYDNYEQMNLYEYSAVLFLLSGLVRQQDAEFTSPFIDADYLEFAYRIPLKWRKDYQMTMTWMTEKYPEAAKYVWQTKRMPVDTYYHHQMYWPKLGADAGRFVLRCVNKAGRVLRLPVQFALNNDMNPIETWYMTNVGLREFLSSYYRENIGRIADPQLRADVSRTFDAGNAMDKLQAVNLLAVYKRYF